MATLEMSFDVHSKEELASLIGKIRQVDSVLDIERAVG